MNDRKGFEFGCKLFYCTHWLALDQDDFGRLLAGNPAAALNELMELVDVLQEANPESHSACLETWCRTEHELLDAQTPAQCVSKGQVRRVIDLVRSLGKLPGEEPIEW